MHRLIFATNNKGKLTEVRKIFGDSLFEIKSLAELDFLVEFAEDGKTFEENAKKKAVEVYKIFKVPVIADDSGLQVERLAGRPGVHSARYAGENASYEENNLKLLRELSNFPLPHRAKFVCTAVYFDGNKYLTAVGEIEGRIASSPEGKNGFGYDPLFIPDGFERTFAQLSLEEKNLISHRSKAFNKLKDFIQRKDSYEK